MDLPLVPLSPKHRPAIAFIFGILLEEWCKMISMPEGFSFKIFLVDEDLFSLAMYDQHFRNMRCSDVHLFDSIAPCVSMMGEQPVVIFLDYRLNPEKGLRILSLVKKLVPDAYIVFIAGPSGIIELLFSLRQGAFEYVLKKDNNYVESMESALKKIQQVETLLNTPKRRRNLW